VAEYLFSISYNSRYITQYYQLKGGLGLYFELFLRDAGVKGVQLGPG
jgi:hypothetical protein